jgi:hypothetical protein
VRIYAADVPTANVVAGNTTVLPVGPDATILPCPLLIIHNILPNVAELLDVIPITRSAVAVDCDIRTASPPPNWYVTVLPVIVVIVLTLLFALLAIKYHIRRPTTPANAIIAMINPMILTQSAISSLLLY